MEDQINTNLLYDIGKAFMSTDDMNLLLTNILTILSKNHQIERGMINIYQQESDEIFIDVSSGYTDDEVKKGIYKPGEGIIGTVISTGKPIVVPSIEKEPKFLNKTGARKKKNIKNLSFICLPIKINKETIGTIAVDILNTSPSSIPDAVQILTTTSIMIAHAVKNRREMIERENKLLNENKLLKIRLNLNRPKKNYRQIPYYKITP